MDGAADLARARDILAGKALAMPLDADQRSAFQQRFNQLPAMHHMGCQLDLGLDAVVQVHLPRVEPHHCGGMGTSAVNGAVLSGLADCAIGVAGVMQMEAQRSGTIDMNIKFLRAAHGDQVHALAIALKRSSSVVFAEAEIYCGGRLCAIANGLVARAGDPDVAF
jgi:uncharacterized protein (TIGR00369 family)